MKKVHAGGNN